MNIPFSRRELQVECEKIARIQQGLSADSDKYVFENRFEVETTNITKLKDCLKHDSVSFYFNAVYSFLQGLKSLSDKSYSWSTVQLYYSVFYSCKAILGFKNIGIIRKGRLSVVELKDGERSKRGIENDHKQAFKTYTEKFASSFILSNKILDQDFFKWIQDAREITNYKQQVFQEPRALKFYSTILNRVKNGETLHHLLDCYSSNWALYCFQEESAIISGSYFLLTEAYNLYALQNEKLTVPQKREVVKLIKELKLQDINIPFTDS